MRVPCRALPHLLSCCRHPLRRLAPSLLLLAGIFCLRPLPAQQTTSNPGPATTLSASSRARLQTLSELPPVPAPARRFLRGRTLADGSSAAQAMSTARAQHSNLVVQQRALIHAHPALQAFGAPWQALGPAAVQSLSYGSVSGRVTSLAVDPGDPTGNTVYLGSSGGGIWKSTNAMADPASVRFSPLTDNLPVFSANAGSAATPSLSIGALSVQPGGIVLAGTGDPNGSSDSFYGGGILRSVDAGVTWTLVSEAQDGLNGNHSFVGLGFSGFAWSTASPSLVVAAVSQSVEGTLVNAPDSTYSVMGLYYSTDAGITWQMATLEDGSQVIQTPLYGGGNHGGLAATAVVWNPVRQRFYAAVRYHGYYESADGATWTRLSIQPSPGLTTAACPPALGLAGAASCPIFRGALATEPVTGDLYALTVDAQNHDSGLFRDICARNGGTGCQTSRPAFASRIPSTALENPDGTGTVAQGDYNLVLSAVPTAAGDTILFVGTHDLFRCSIAAGCVLRNATNTANGCNAPALVAPAQHAIAAGSGTAVTPGIFFGNDSGLWRSTDLVNQQASACSSDDAAHFQNLNGSLGSLAEVVSLAQDPTSPTVLLAGLGAAGTASLSGAGWLQLSAAEGGMVAIDPANPALWYVTTAAGISIRLCANGAACTTADVAGLPTIGPAAVSNDDARLDAPWLLDPAQATQLIAGTCRVWRGPAEDGSTWASGNALSPMLSGPQGSRCNVAANPLIRSLAVGGTPASMSSASPVLYAGISGLLSGGGTIAGHVFRAPSPASGAIASTPWIDLAASPVTNDVIDHQLFNPGKFDISSLTVDPHDSTGQTVYATVMGFAGNGVSSPHLYRSGDGGAHWLNISSNLPNAPANSVLVDPNDANTVYVALDTGVYATSGVSTCTVSNCWTVLGTALPNAPAIQLAAAAGMPTGDGRRGELRVSTSGRGIWQIPLLTALADSAPLMTVNPTALSFASQAVGTLGGSVTVLVTNSGNAPLTISRVTATGDFQAGSTCTQSSVAVGSSCVVQVSFLPTAVGPRTGLLTIYGNVPGGQATVALSGTATPAAAVVLTPVVLPFPSTTVGARSAAENIAISNTGTTPATIGAPAVSGDFVITANTCGTTLGPSIGCTVSVVFTPKAAGDRTGLFTINTGAGTLTAALDGTAMAPPTDTLSATALTFAAQPTGGASTAQTLVMTNAGDAPLTLISAQITAGDFSVINTCGNSLAGHATCTLGVVFGPRTLGPQTGTLVVSDAFRSQTVTLSGTGIAPPGISVSPANALTFTATPVNTSSAPQLVTLSNNGGGPVAITGTTLTGDFALGSGSTCAGTVAAGAACSFAILFTPTATGTRAGTLTVTDTSPAGQHILRLTGSGLDFTVAADGETSASVASGAQAAFPLLITSDTGVSGSASLQCTGAPANSTCTLSPSAVPLGNGTTLVVAMVSTGVQPATAALRAHARLAAPPLWLAALVPGTLLLLRRKGARQRWTGLVLVLFTITGFGGCGVGRTVPPSGTGTAPSSPLSAVTPSGTYSISVNVSSAGLTRQVQFTLTVQ